MTAQLDKGGLNAVDGSSEEDQLIEPITARLDERVGRFLGRPCANRWVWDQSLFAILGYTGTDGPASLDALLNHVPEDERHMVADAFETVVGHGRPALVWCPIHNLQGQVRSVLITAEALELEPSGLSMAPLLEVDGLASATGPWLSGQVIDLTQLRLGAIRAASTDAIQHRSIIDRALGMIMVTQQVDAGEAFQRLRRHSNNTNITMRELAVRLVAEVTDPSCDPASTCRGPLLGPSSRHD